MKLEELFAAVLDVPQNELDETSSPETIMSWTSMAAMTLVAAMEETYGVSFSTQEISAMKTIGDARRVLREKGAAT